MRVHESGDSDGNHESKRTGIPTGEVQRVREELSARGGATWATPEYDDQDRFKGTHTVTNTRKGSE
ncbi:hypothetical protein AB0L00_27445 [Actinoallomurus sp. NPDC052308]|uniref:hypothetical protein n=1 Tax=Actinoallomurus sp. NPDC052308 TaxID=3155530 RepID=UPI0034189F22